MTKWTTIFVSLVVVFLATTALRHFQPPGEPELSFRTQRLVRGSLSVTVSATGTVEPENVIDVGTQVAGQIVSFGQDINGKAVDYGSEVDAGTVLVKIDDSLYLAEVDQAKAKVQSAAANLQRAQADLVEAKAKLYQAERDWQRAENLASSEFLAQSSYDAYKSAFEVSKANVAVEYAAILQAKAGLKEAEAILRRAQLNLGYCTIKSPIKGVIIDRRVDIGQTVVASLDAPSLFLLAKDLRRMQIWVSVNEADIGEILPGQAATFTVDAFPGETFQGDVGKVRLNASMTQNVVTYVVEINTDNSTGRLLPYLTANVKFVLDHREDVLLLPSAALRLKSPADKVLSKLFEAKNDSIDRRDIDRESSPDETGSEDTRENAADRGIIWLQEGQTVRPIHVRMGLSDGVMTEVQGDGLKEGQDVILGLRTESGKRRNDQDEMTSPFLTKLPPRPQRGSSPR